MLFKTFTSISPPFKSIFASHPVAKGKVTLAASFVLTRNFQNIFLIGGPWFHHLETILSCQSLGKAVEKGATLSLLLNLVSNILLVTVVGLLFLFG